MESSKVVQLRNVQQASAVAVLPQTVGDQIREQANKSFSDLFRNAVETSEQSPEGKLPVYGPYGKVIIYKPNGEVIHTAGTPINRLRAARAFTTNAIEMTCEALGLVVYVSGLVQLDPSDRSGRRGIREARIVAYEGEAIGAKLSVKASTADQLVDHLHKILLGTYNRLSREFNLAGFQSGWLTLKSSRKDVIPNIPLCLSSSTN